jgi:hypothetical protein
MHIRKHHYRTMQQFYIVIAIIIFGFALRSCRTVLFRKLGALVMLIASGLCFYYLTGSILAGIVAAAAWFFLPWVELLTRIRSMRMPVENELEDSFSTNLDIFPNATKHISSLQKAGYEHIRNCGWNLGGMDQLYQLFWNAETRSVATLCLCEQSKITFTYLTITSRDITDGVWRTTNFPFSPTLKLPPRVHSNQVSCADECAEKLIVDHEYFLYKQGFIDDDLSIPDPDNLKEEIENELRAQINHNLKSGIIQLTGDGHFRYTLRGLLFLWKQFVKDMIRLC